jgi:hypothetical protein
MKFDDMQFSLSFVQWIVIAALAIYTWFNQRQSATSAEVTNTNVELAAVRERVVALEIEMKNMPSEATVRELIGKLERLTAYNEGNKEQLNAVQHTVNRINDYLINKG